MPVRKRADRRKPSTSLDDWQEVFETGYDGFSDLRYAGIAIDKDGRPDREEARAAWLRFGRAFLEDYAIRNPNGPGRYGPPWALTEFGPPR